MTSLVAFPAALVSVLILTPVVKTLALRLSFVDVPDGKRFHRRPTPLLGGVALLASVLVGWAVGHLVSGLTLGYGELLVILGLLFSFGLGLRDDKFGMPARWKLVAQTTCALLLVSGCYVAGWVREGFMFPFFVVWVVAMMNATNFLDNMDGIACGVSSCASLAFAALLSLRGHSAGAILAASLFGASAGFLRFNFSPASIFLGDAGSLPIGYLLAGLSIMVARDAAIHSLAVPLVVLAYPVFDITFVTIVRLKEKRKIYQGGKDHSTHRLAACYGSARKTALVVYVLCLGLGAAGLLIERIEKPAFSFSLGAILVLFFVLFGLRLDRVKPYRALTGP